MSKDKGKRKARVDKWLKRIKDSNFFGGYAINVKHRVQLAEDKDLQHMLKKGIIRRIRSSSVGRKNITLLVLK